MSITANRHGIAVMTKGNHVLSLGWNIWGIDMADGRFVIVHIWKPRLFINLEKR